MDAQQDVSFGASDFAEEPQQPLLSLNVNLLPQQRTHIATHDITETFDRMEADKQIQHG
tara:strand:- start:374 stop:550 length:177 start_codon:yes stop_codon:yes gene_type:complete